jgi:transposase
MIRRRWTWHSGIPRHSERHLANGCSKGQRVEDLAAELGISAATLWRWKHQALIDAGRKPGARSFEPDELARARQRIKDLESELEIVKAAAALFNGEEVIRPKGSAQSFED